MVTGVLILMILLVEFGIGLIVGHEYLLNEMEKNFLTGRDLVLKRVRGRNEG